jgi:hypothetical protein
VSFIKNIEKCFTKVNMDVFVKESSSLKNNVIVPQMTKVPPNVTTINGQNYDLMYS